MPVHRATVSPQYTIRVLRGPLQKPGLSHRAQSSRKRWDDSFLVLAQHRERTKGSPRWEDHETPPAQRSCRGTESLEISTEANAGKGSWRQTRSEDTLMETAFVFPRPTVCPKCRRAKGQGQQALLNGLARSCPHPQLMESHLWGVCVCVRVTFLHIGQLS